MQRMMGKSRKEENGGYYKVLHWFFSRPGETSLTELALRLKISKTTANKVVRLLEKEGFLKKEVLGRIWRISCNPRHDYNVSRKISYNLGLVYESGIIKEIRFKIPSARAIILFGSYRKGDDNNKSDIDIAVEIPDNEELHIISLGILSQLGYRKNIPVNVHVFSRNKINLNLFSNIANGIVLDGFLEVKP